MNYTKINQVQIDSSQAVPSSGSSPRSLIDQMKEIGVPGDLQIKLSEQLARVTPEVPNEILSKYAEWILRLPWEKRTTDVLEIQKAAEVLEKEHYGLTDLKRRVLEYISVLMLQRQQKTMQAIHSPILFFVGLAGTGKTTFAKSVATALGREFVRIPFGGLSSVYDLRGLSKVSPQAEPGLIIKALVQCKSKNPVILLDELDRVTPEARAGIMGVLIELLDPEQNAHFTDHYIDYPFDLSEVIFIATANNSTTISTAVLDRLEVIQMPSYNDEEKITIGKKFLLPNLLQNSGLAPNTVTVSDDVWTAIARASGYDPGIRSVERKVEAIVRKAAFKIVSGQGKTFAINEGNMKEWTQ